MRRMRRLLTACAAIGLSMLALPGSASGRLLFLEVVLNNRPTNLVASFNELPDGRFAATRAELEEIGLEPSGSGVSDELVPLDLIADLTYRYDEANQRIDIAVSEAGRKAREYDALPRQDEEDDETASAAKAGFGGVINYGLYGSSSLDSNDLIRPQALSGTVDGRMFSPFGTLSQSGIFRAAGLSEPEWLRLDSALEITRPDSMISLKLGDTISGGLAWTRPVRFGGVQLRRSFELRPDLVTAPLPSASGSAAVPSVVDLYVDGVKAFSQEVDAGPFQINNLPLVSGSGKARLVVRDAAGRETETEVPFFASSELLRPGLLDFSLEAGRPRIGYASADDSYSEDLFASASLRGGVFDWLTLEGHAEISERLINAGAGAVGRIGSVALVSAAVSASRFEEETGAQLYAAVETELAGISLQASTQRSFGEYHDLASALMDPRWHAQGTAFGNHPWLIADGKVPRSIHRITASIPLPFSHSAISASFANVVEADGRDTQVISGSWSRPLPFNSTLHATAFAYPKEERRAGFFVGLQMPLGTSTAASVSTASGDGEMIGRFDAGKPLQRKDGSFGWRVHASKDRQEHYSAELSYRSRYGRFKGGVSSSPTGLQSHTEADGALVIMDGVFATNRIDDAFAVVDAGAPDVEILYENRPVARTGRSGKALIPELRSHERNKISVDVLSTPLGTTLSRTDETVMPGSKAGIYVDLAGHQAGESALVILTREDGTPLPVGSVGRLNGSSEEEFVVGYDGQAFLNGLLAFNRVEVALASGSCTSSFNFAPQQGTPVAIGPFVCK